MGMIINPGSDMYEQALATNTHVDKSGWLCYINTVISTQKKYVCVSRPRRFGKTMAANMISAYYDCTTNGPILFKDKKIMQDSSFEVHANKYNVLKINMIDFMTSASSIEEMITNLKEDIIDDIMEEFPDIDFGDKINFTKVIEKLYRNTKRKYVIIIDEWDCVFRRY
ncbi:MAG: AAA family ATPase, partial [Selenomonadales bacterium]|nr:AAA family ATPase [Selenomonadales bacterium]